MKSNYKIPLEKIAAIAAGLVYSDKMTVFMICSKSNIPKIFFKYLIKNLIKCNNYILLSL